MPPWPILDQRGAAPPIPPPEVRVAGINWIFGKKILGDKALTSERYPYGYGNIGYHAAEDRPRASSRARNAQAAQRRPANANRAPARRPANAGRTGSRRPAPKRRRLGWRALPAKLRLVLCVAVLALAVFAGVKLIGGRIDHAERFVDNVYVNGVNLSGYTREEGYALLTELKESAMNATYQLVYGDRSFDFRPADFNVQYSFDSEFERAWNLGHVGDKATRRQIVESLKSVPAEFNSEMTYDEKALDAYIDGLAEALDRDPVNAEVTLTEQKPMITRASENGLRLNRETTRENLETLIKTGEADTRLPVEEVLPSIASDDMEMKIVAKVSTDVTFRGYNSRTNVRTALNHFNCFTVYPGDTVDFNAVVGPRTEALGFLQAPEYAGNDLTQGIGGGVCQASTTLYDAAVMANMTIIERHNHSMTVSYVKPSQDAAVEYGSKNFVFRNDTEYTYYIYTNVDKEWATVTIYGTRPTYHYELESSVVSESKSDRNRYEDDTSGKYAYYVTDTKLKTEGHGSCRSEGWIVAYDWDTKQEVSREQVSYDVYTAGYNVYWRGIHNPDGTTVAPAT